LIEPGSVQKKKAMFADGKDVKDGKDGKDGKKEEDAESSSSSSSSSSDNEDNKIERSSSDHSVSRNPVHEEEQNKYGK
jgi:hypothetical protein